jgi:tagatose-1,6-bisphosphate aldolase non-catalytic subunit AgaZ/GatZ
MKKKTAQLVPDDNFLVDLTFHSVPASLISEFLEKIVKPYYKGNLNVAIQDLINKVIAEQDLVLSHVTHIRSSLEA